MSDDQAATPAKIRERLHEVLKKFSTAMVVTHAPVHGMHARPMAIAKQKEEGKFYFATSYSSAKASEVQENSDVLLSFQDGNTFASLSGKCRIVRDRALIHELWSEAWKVWFPNGKDDPDLCLLAVDADAGEYWDNSGLKGLTYMFEAARAYVKGDTPKADADHNAKVKL